MSYLRDITIAIILALAGVNAAEELYARHIDPGCTTDTDCEAQWDRLEGQQQ